MAVRIDLAFKAFFRRVKAHEEEPGFPRFKGCGRYDSFTFPQSSFSLSLSPRQESHDGRITLSKIGSIKMVYHREVKGSIKTCTIHKSSTGKWYVSFSVECEPLRLLPCPDQVGIDVGLHSVGLPQEAPSL